MATRDSERRRLNAMEGRRRRFHVVLSTTVSLGNRHPPDLLRIAIRLAERHIDPAAV
jgi:hypothetical protein